MLLRLFNVHMDKVMKEVKMGLGWMGLRFLDEGREWRLPGLLYADDLVLCGELEENRKKMVGRFLEVCRRRDLKVNADKEKIIVLAGYVVTGSEVFVDVTQLERQEICGCYQIPDGCQAFAN